MKTSYFAKLKQIKYPVSIAAKAPVWYTALGKPEYKKLAPTYSILNAYKNGGVEKGDTELYTRRFNNEVLSKLDILNVLFDLNEFYGSDGVALDELTLLCYEKPGDFCHRHLVADWIRKHGYNCEEVVY